MQLPAVHMPAGHTALAQSPLTTQTLPAAQPGHTPPPQSTSVSRPFFVMSVQLGPAQTFPTQELLTQSPLTRQARPPLHFGHIPPPQSTAVSMPFFTMS